MIRDRFIFHIIFCLFLGNHTVVAQNLLELPFNGYYLAQYKQPVPTPSGGYEAMYENLGDQRGQGHIELDLKNRTFAVRWMSGDNMICRYEKVETVEEFDSYHGQVTRQLYHGWWSDDNEEAMLVITRTESEGCVTSIRSRKVIDLEYGIDTWKKISTFGTMGVCID